MASSGLSGTSTQALPLVSGISPQNSGEALLTLASSRRQVLTAGFFRSSGLLNQYRMNGSDVLQARRWVNNRPGPWGSFRRISNDQFRSSAGHVYTIVNQNEIVFNNTRWLYRRNPIPITPDTDNSGNGCIKIGEGLQLCF